jgi:ATP-dependent helicase/DNAse subunit B
VPFDMYSSTRALNSLPNGSYVEHAVISFTRLRWRMFLKALHSARKLLMHQTDRAWILWQLLCDQFRQVMNLYKLSQTAPNQSSYRRKSTGCFAQIIVW